MADLSVVSSGKIRVVGMPAIQLTLVAAEAITAGEAVRIDTSAGKFTGSNGSSTTENRIYGIAKATVAAGQPVTAIRKGLLDGFDLSGMNYDAAVYLSDTDGTLATSAGTVSTIVGRVVPGLGQVLGTAPDKLLFVDL